VPFSYFSVRFNRIVLVHGRISYRIALKQSNLPLLVTDGGAVGDLRFLPPTKMKSVSRSLNELFKQTNKQ